MIEGGGFAADVFPARNAFCRVAKAGLMEFYKKTRRPSVVGLRMKHGQKLCPRGLAGFDPQA
jgi:hypothetical protein